MGGAVVVLDRSAEVRRVSSVGRLDLRQQYARLALVVNNTGNCSLELWQRHNRASRVPALCERQLNRDWVHAFGHPLLLEIFVNRQHHRGTLYLTASRSYVEDTLGPRRRRVSYTDEVQYLQN
jgi:hypothetical protein